MTSFVLITKLKLKNPQQHFSFFFSFFSSIFSFFKTTVPLTYSYFFYSPFSTNYVSTCFVFSYFIYVYSSTAPSYSTIILLVSLSSKFPALTFFFKIRQSLSRTVRPHWLQSSQKLKSREFSTLMPSLELLLELFIDIPNLFCFLLKL